MGVAIGFLVGLLAGWVLVTGWEARDQRRATERLHQAQQRAAQERPRWREWDDDE
jgi:uncharacterized membrane protein YccC